MDAWRIDNAIQHVFNENPENAHVALLLARRNTLMESKVEHQRKSDWHAGEAESHLARVYDIEARLEQIDEELNAEMGGEE